uniref:Uncharacterized protein n=1 Tax=Rhizophora mucronata TaxID=61149 RepID=A0A2P2KNB5_RHIMU
MHNTPLKFSSIFVQGKDILSRTRMKNTTKYPLNCSVYSITTSSYIFVELRCQSCKIGEE